VSVSLFPPSSPLAEAVFLWRLDLSDGSPFSQFASEASSPPLLMKGGQAQYYLFLPQVNTKTRREPSGCFVRSLFKGAQVILIDMARLPTTEGSPSTDGARLLTARLSSFTLWGHRSSFCGGVRTRSNFIFGSPQKFVSRPPSLTLTRCTRDLTDRHMGYAG